jgi:mRNA interferase MazF
MPPAYIPAAGDIVWLQFNLHAGHEQAGHRLAQVLSPARYIGTRGMMVCCPMTSKIKGYVFEVVASESPPSAVLADQLRSLDWRARGAVHKGSVSKQTIAHVKAKIKSLLAI